MLKPEDRSWAFAFNSTSVDRVPENDPDALADPRSKAQHCKTAVFENRKRVRCTSCEVSSTNPWAFVFIRHESRFGRCGHYTTSPKILCKNAGTNFVRFRIESSFSHCVKYVTVHNVIQAG